MVGVTNAKMAVYSLTEKERNQLSLALRASREEVGVSQSKIASEIGCSISHVRNVEAGGSDPSLGFIVAYARLLDVEAHSILRPAAL